MDAIIYGLSADIINSSYFLFVQFVEADILSLLYFYLKTAQADISFFQIFNVLPPPKKNNP